MLRRLTLLTFLLCAFPVSAQTPKPKFYIETKDQKTFTAEMSTTIECKTVAATEWLFYVAQPIDLPTQSGLKVTTSIKGLATKELSQLGRPIHVINIPVRQPAQLTEASFTTTYSGTLKTRQLKELTDDVKAPEVPKLTQAERVTFTREIGDFDFSAAAYKKWLADQKFTKAVTESDLEFARRVFQDIRKEFTYEYKNGMDRKVSSVCKAGKSDCGGLSLLFCSVLRANKIPARTLFGRWAKSAEKGEKLGEVPYFQWHVKSEFYADGIGWVPVEISSAVSHKNAKEEAYFGKFEADFVVLHFDPNFLLPVTGGQTTTSHNLQNPGWYVKGKGDTSGAKLIEDWQVKTEAVKK